jgi:UDP-2,4-diacetamido-2,4,6-trideoxy-beta-L-altropyranose hydrolase
MLKSNLLIFVDGDHKIGLGHISRQMSLVHVWKNFNVVFFTSTPSIKKLVSKKYSIVTYDPFNLHSLKNKIIKLDPGIIILDKLKERSSIIKLLQNCCQNVVSIDYIGKNKHILQKGFSILYPVSGVSTYSSTFNFDYVILKKSFLKQKPIKIKKHVKSIIILQGGADTHCFIPKIISSLFFINDEIKITIVLGNEFKCWKKLNSIILNDSRISIRSNVKNMANLLQNYDLAITAAGNTVLEVAYLGIPSIIVCAEKFENETAEFIEKIGFGINLGFGKNLPIEKITKTVKSLMNDYELRKTMNRVGKSLIDGNGTERIYNVIVNGDPK